MMSMIRKIAPLVALAIAAGCNDAPAGNAAAPVGSDSATHSATQSAPAPAPAPRDSRKVILFVGTSLTAGYGIGADYAYPAVIQQKIDSAGLPYRVVNAGISGETSAGGLRRIDWALQQPVDVLVLELGANDALRGLSVDSMKSNLNEIVQRTRAKYPEAKIVIVGMEAPPNLGSDYTTRFRAAFREVAKSKRATLVPFLLEGVGGVRALNQQDGIHPTIEGQRMLASNVWRYLAPLLR
jgi:acyl-CoA thioesterase-1